MRSMMLNPGREFQPEHKMSARRREREGVKKIQDISKANTVVGSSQPLVGEGPNFRPKKHLDILPTKSYLSHGQLTDDI